MDKDGESSLEGVRGQSSGDHSRENSRMPVASCIWSRQSSGFLLLKPDNIWFSGPSFLRSNEYTESALEPDGKLIEAEKKKATRHCHAQSSVGEEFLKVGNFSTFHKLRKRVAFLRRPFRNWRLKRSKHLTKLTTRNATKGKDIQQHPIEPLSTDELREAEIWLLRRDQSIYFAKEIAVLEKQQTGLRKTKTKKMLVSKSFPLYTLSPFIDEEGLVRVGRRLERSPLSYDCRHPIILGKGSHLAALLIRKSHEDVKHFGVNTVLCNLRQRYWPIRGREQVKKILSSCVLCKKWRGNSGVQFMADLPLLRVNFPNPPFTLTGVDYFGPIITKAGFRGGRRQKRYGVVFTCLQTRAVHLEIAQSLSTDDFLKVLSRFVARRSKPKRMFSDQRTNFAGAEREMRQLVKELCSDVVLKAKLQQEGLDWNFNPPFAPHMGGAWESMVKLAKRAITAARNAGQLTDDELSTVAAECQAMLNNRPLTYVGSDPDDVEPLTPAHFLAAGQLMPLLPSEIQVEDVSPKRRWLFLQSIMSKIWKRWQTEYLPCLQRRPKWNQLAKRAITAARNGGQLTDDELSTVAAECQTMLNNRPLTYVGSDPDDVEPLTPAHFLAAGQLMPLLPSEIQVEDVSPKRRWLFLQSIMSKIWKRWQTEYLPCLQRRPKWNQPVRNLEPGDLVLILDPNQPRRRWLRGKIEKTFPDD